MSSKTEAIDMKPGPNTRSRKRKALGISEEPAAALPNAETASRLGVPAAASAPPKRRKTTRPKAAAGLKKPPPGSESSDDDAAHNCCICMSNITDVDLTSVNGCEHKFCFGCIEQWAKRENSCPLCKARFTEIRRDNKKRGVKNVRKIKQRDQRSDIIPSAALEGLLASFASHAVPSQNIARLIFSGGAGSFFEIRGGNQPPTVPGGPDFHTFGGLFRAMNGHGLLMGGGGPGLQIVRPMVVGQSFASNSDDATAGNRAENPLEIDDDSDDEEVEVVQVRQNVH